MGLFIVAWFYHYLVAAVLSGPLLYLGRRRVSPEQWELAVFVSPFLIRALLMEFGKEGKTLVNFFVEPCYLSLAIPFAVLARVLIGDRVKQKPWSSLLILLIRGAAAAIYFPTPSLPEQDGTREQAVRYYFGRNLGSCFSHQSGQARGRADRTGTRLRKEV